MNEILAKKYKSLEMAEDYACWYLVKQPTEFSQICYLVSALESYQKNDNKEDLQKYIVSYNEKLDSSLSLSSNYRALRVAAFFGLIIMNGSRYDEAIITPAFEEIKARTNGAFENTELYLDIIERQIEKMFISSEIDEKSKNIRRSFRLYPIMLLYKVLLELGRSIGKYTISIDEYRYIVATTEKFNGFLDALLYIKLFREFPDDVEQFTAFKDKFDSRLIQALKQLPGLDVDTRTSITIKPAFVEAIARKVYLFEENPDIFESDNYLEFLGSTKSLLDLKLVKQNASKKSIFNCSIYRNRIFFGAPGTGKSYSLNEAAKALVGNENTQMERVTFHPDYTYANFVGSYKPIMKQSNIEYLDDDSKKVLSVLNDSTKTTQEKYDALYESFKSTDGLTRLPIILGLYFDDSFETKKEDGTKVSNNNSVERNHGRAIRKYVQLLSKESYKEKIAYEYVPGPFIRLLVKALQNPDKPYVLIIEEINRANVAAVFGEVFQLLDRNNNGESEYSINTTADMRAYLHRELGYDKDVTTIKIPSNMFIWATMNSADQGVYPMDTAFKRRWTFSYYGLDDEETKLSDAAIKPLFTLGKSTKLISWNGLRKAINDELSTDTYNINEDKLMGPFFLKEDALKDNASFNNAFKNKVLMYLFDDVIKQKRRSFFKCKNSNRYSSVCNALDLDGIKVFPDGVVNSIWLQVDETVTSEDCETRVTEV
jgi:type II restriction-modification system restriction subunit